MDVKIQKKDEVIHWTDQEEKLVENIVSQWNQIVTQYENQTIRFGQMLCDLLKQYPESTAQEIIKRVKEHPDLKMTMSRDRIYQGWRLVRNNPKLAKYTLQYEPDQLKELPDDEKPILKRDGSVAVEHYLELYKRPGQLDETMKSQLEKQARDENWTVKQLKEKIKEATMELKEPEEQKKIQRTEKINNINLMMKTLDYEDVLEVEEFVSNKINQKEQKKRDKDG